jgi:hypothetical protein
LSNDALTEKDYRIALKAALAINAVGEALDAMTGLAQRWLERGSTQEGANLLVFVMNHPDVRYDTFDRAEEMFLDLEARACPRVILDAKEFILGKSLATMAAHIFSLQSDE